MWKHMINDVMTESGWADGHKHGRNKHQSFQDITVKIIM